MKVLCNAYFNNLRTKYDCKKDIKVKPYVKFHRTLANIELEYLATKPILWEGYDDNQYFK